MDIPSSSSFRGVAARPPLSPRQFQPAPPASTRPSTFGASSSSVNHGKSSVRAPISWKDYIPLIRQEVRRVVNSNKKSARTNVENKSINNRLFRFDTIKEEEEREQTDFGDDTNNNHQYNGSYDTQRAESFGSVFNLDEYFPEEIDEGRKNRGKQQSQVVDVQNRRNDSAVTDYENMEVLSLSNYIMNVDQFGDFHAASQNSTKSFGVETPGKNIDSLSFKNSISFRNHFGESHETPLTSSIKSLNTQSLGSSFSFGEHITKSNKGSNADKLAEQAEKFSVQNQSSDGLFSDSGIRGKNESKDKSDEAFEMPPTISTEDSGMLSLNLGYNFDDYHPEMTQTMNTIHPENHTEMSNAEEKHKGMFLSGIAGEGTRVEPAFSYPVASFAFTSKYGGSEAPKKESKSPRRRYIKIQKKGGHKTQAKKIGDSSAASKINFEETSSLKTDNVRGDPAYFKPSSADSPLFSTSIGDANISGSNFSFSEATYLDPILLKRDGRTTSYGSLTVTTNDVDRPSFFDVSKNSDKTPIPISEPEFGKRNMSRVGHSSFKVRSDVPMRFGGPDLLRSFSFPSKPCSGFRNDETHVLPNIGKIGTSRSAGMENDGEKWQARGKEVHEKGDIKSAEEFFTRGIKSLASDETYQSRNRSLMLCYSNRAAVRMSLGNIRAALSDCLAASKIDPSFPKVQLQIANCLIALGNIEEATKQFNKCLDLNNNENTDSAIFSEASSGLNKAHKVMEYISLAENLINLDSEQIPKALDLISDALSLSYQSERLMEMKANALLKLRRYEEAIQHCEQIPESGGKDYISNQWRLNIIAKSYFCLGRLDKALEVVKRNEQSAIDSEWYETDSTSSQTDDTERYEIKFAEPDTSFIVTLRKLARLKDAGNEAFCAGKYTEAVEHYSAAIACSTESWFFTAVCLRNRAAAYRALGQIVDAIADCSLAIALDPTDTKAFSRRAALYGIIRDYNQAANDLHMLISLLEKQQQESGKTSISEDLNRAHHRLLSAEESAKRRIPLNLYLILGVEESASVDDVKEAYNKAAIKHNPDEAIQALPKNEKADNDATWLEVTGRVRNDADHLFKLIGEAYAVLSDTSKRAQFDLDEKKMDANKTHRDVGAPWKPAPGR